MILLASLYLNVKGSAPGRALALSLCRNTKYRSRPLVEETSKQSVDGVISREVTGSIPENFLRK
jgi:hypothetical protein